MASHLDIFDLLGFQLWTHMGGWLLLSLGVLSIGAISSSGEEFNSKLRPIAFLVAKVILFAVLLRVGFLVGVPMDPDHRNSLVQVYSAMIIAGLSGVLATDLLAILASGAVFLYGAVQYIAVFSGEITNREDACVLGVMFLSGLLIGVGCLRSKVARGVTTSLMILLISVVVGRLLYVSGIFPLDLPE